MKCPRCSARLLQQYDWYECVTCAYDSRQGIARMATEEDYQVARERLSFEYAGVHTGKWWDEPEQGVLPL